MFFLDHNISYSYEKLFNDLKSANSFYDNYNFKDVYSFYKNMLVAVLSNKDITLVDQEIIDSLSLDDENIECEIDRVNFIDASDFLEKVKKSTSGITLYTSGTTGLPKKIVHTIDSLTKTVKIFNNKKELVWGMAYNPSHMAGLQVFFQALLNLNTIALFFEDTPEVVYEKINTFSITNLSATPTFYKMLVSDKKVFDSVNRLTLGGEKSSQDLLGKLEKMFPKAKISNIYASTEFGALLSSKGDSFSIPQDLRDKVKIVNNELFVHKSFLGENSNLNYEGDFYKTGDLVEFQDKENFVFSNRDSELINVGGNNVNPLEIEHKIIEYIGISSAYVYSKQNALIGNILCADIVLNEEVNFDEISLKKFLNNAFPSYKVPRKIKIVSNLVTTRTGKLKR